MSRIVRVHDTAYKIAVNSGGTITLSTGDQAGTVVVTGDLLVQGNTTTVQSENMTVKDNVIVLNSGQTGTHISLGYSGIQIDRGSGRGGDRYAELFYDESVEWFDSQSETTKYGAFIFKTSAPGLVGVRTNAISTGGYDLSFLEENSSAVIKVAAIGYENNVSDINDIPNVGWVQNFATDYFNSTPPQFIQRSDSVLRIYDQFNDPSFGTLLQLKLDSVVNAEFRPTRFDIQSIRLSDGTIETTIGSGSKDLVLRAAGSGSVTIDDNLKINVIPVGENVPEYEAGGTKIYTQTETYDAQTNAGLKHYGGTGIYFVNNETVRDELISRRKSIVYSMIF